jgi:hypothetical protein
MVKIYPYWWEAEQKKAVKNAHIPNFHGAVPRRGKNFVAKVHT